MIRFSFVFSLIAMYDRRKRNICDNMCIMWWFQLEVEGKACVRFVQQWEEIYETENVNFPFESKFKINPCVFHSMSRFGPESVSVRSTDWRHRGIHAPGAPVTWEVPCCLLVFVRRKCIITAAVKMFLTTKDKSCFRANMIKTLQCPSKNKNKSPSSKSSWHKHIPTYLSK